MKSFSLTRLFFLGILGSLSCFRLGADGPVSKEFQMRDEWLGPFLGVTQPSIEPHLELLYQDAADGVSRGRSWRGTPYQLGSHVYTNGLAFNSTKHFKVVLGQAADRFIAEVGLENNDDTQRGAQSGAGSVTFHVLVDGREVISTPVMRLKDEPRRLDVPLQGVDHFEIRVKDGGDGRGWDQALWANAFIRLQSGALLSLPDLPVRDASRKKLSLAQPPFSFIYNGKSSAELLPQWGGRHQSERLDEKRTQHLLTYADPATGLQVRCVLIEYHDFPTLEWTLYFKNAGNQDTPILEKIQALDMELTRDNEGEFLLRHNTGSPADGNDYRPLQTPLLPDSKKRLGGARGRPTNEDWSYFNLDYSGRGLIVAVGWPGQWTTEMIRDKGRNLSIRSGQELTRFKLLPGEEVRSPLMAMQFWSGDWIHAQNVWRRWMMGHSMPKPGGSLPPPQLLASSSRQYDEMIKANQTNQTMFIDRYLEEGIQLDYWWMDAGWYVHHGGGWPRVGTWLVDSNRFPNGLRAVSDYAHARGLKTLLWFEPERVTPGTWLATNHPEWILGGTQGGLLNLGNEAARVWLTEHVDTLLTEQGIDLYRQDFNMDPLDYWRKQDAPDRQGIAEIKHVTGYLEYWDELRRRHPHMLIDSCASGGRRNDLETMRRAVPLWRSDYAYEAIGHQSMMYGLSLWLPYHGTGTVGSRNASYYGSGKTPIEPYAVWSNAGQSLAMGLDIRERELDYPQIRKLVAQWRELAPNYYGDFYPLTPCSMDDTVWIAWQFDRPEAGQGMVQVFRRHQSFYESARFKLRGLEAEATYQIKEVDSGVETRKKGRELMEEGLPVRIPEQPGVVNFSYRRS